MDDILKDKRFAHVAKDPRFRKMPVGERKVKIDTRFKHMFKDKKFKMKYSVDKRGRPVNLTTNENLKKYYELSDKDTSDEDNIEEEKEIVNERKKKQDARKGKKEKQEIRKKPVVEKLERAVANSSDESSSRDSDSEESGLEKVSIKDSGVDFARGEGNISSSSSSSDDDSDDDDNEDNQDTSNIEHRWGETDDNVVSVEEATSRLAVCNMDWDRMKARDIYVLLNSFKPSSGHIKSVKIYPSEFGKERMHEEEKQGPQELTEVKLEDDEAEDTDDKDGTQYNMEKLREYQLKRLRYYYAVVEFDSVKTADEVYKECDGMEYESSSTKVDLRFIPDDMCFDETEVKSSCTEAPVGYKPQFFANAALSQSKVDLTWDETDRERVQLAAQQFSNKADGLAEDDLKAYLASSSDEEGPDYSVLLEDKEGNNESEEEKDFEDRQVDKYKKLLQDIDQETSKSEKDVQMEITWEPGLREATEDLVNKKKQAKHSTVWDEYLQKKKEKKKKKIEERKKKKQKKKDEDNDEDVDAEQEEVGELQAFSDDELPDGVDRDDPFFSQQLSDKQSHKHSKKKKKKKGKAGKKQDEVTAEDSQEKAELSLLMMGGEADDKKHFNYSDLIEQDGQKKKKKKDKGKVNKSQEDEFKVNVADPRFSAMFDSHLFNIDPSAPEYKKTKGTEAIIAEKLKRSDKKQKKKRTHVVETVHEEPVKKMKLDFEKPVEESLASLVKSVKAKTKHFQSNKTKK